MKQHPPVFHSAVGSVCGGGQGLQGVEWVGTISSMVLGINTLSRGIVDPQIPTSIYVCVIYIYNYIIVINYMCVYIYIQHIYPLFVHSIRCLKSMVSVNELLWKDNDATNHQDSTKHVGCPVKLCAQTHSSYEVQQFRLPFNK